MQFEKTIKVKQSKEHEHTEQHLCSSSYNYLSHERRPSYNCCQIERSKAPFSNRSARHHREPNDLRYQLRTHSRPHEESWNMINYAEPKYEKSNHSKKRVKMLSRNVQMSPSVRTNISILEAGNRGTQVQT